jgi:signal transduction histidine kinase
VTDRSGLRWYEWGLMAALLVIGVFGTAGASRNQGQIPTPLTFLLVVLAILPLLVQHRYPLWTFGLTSAVTLVYLGLSFAYGPILLTLAVVIVGLTLRQPLRTALTGMGALLAGATLTLAIGVVGGSRAPTEFLSMIAWLALPAAIGVAVKARRDATTDVRAALARRLVSEERLRLAQEVHDVAGHGFSVIAMQAGVALRVFDRDPAGARAALEGIRAASREALESLRAEIEALREDVPLRPSSGLADLPALAERIRAGGLPLTLTTTRGLTVAPEVDRAAYRIVQESLTNVLRHAGPDATARVSVRAADGTLLVSIVDTGQGGPVDAGGRGIDGMRARAAALGGTLDAGPGAGPGSGSGSGSGGFAVHARLPLRSVR